MTLPSHPVSTLAPPCNLDRARSRSLQAPACRWDHATWLANERYAYQWFEFRDTVAKVPIPMLTVHLESRYVHDSPRDIEVMRLRFRKDPRPFPSTIGLHRAAGPVSHGLIWRRQHPGLDDTFVVRPLQRAQAIPVRRTASQHNHQRRVATHAPGLLRRRARSE